MTDFLKDAPQGKAALLAALRPLGLIQKRAGKPSIVDSKGDVPEFVVVPASGCRLTELEYAQAIAMLANAGLTQSEIARVLDRKETWVSFINKLNSMPKAILRFLGGTVRVTALIKAVDLFGVSKCESALRNISTQRPGKKVTERQLREYCQQTQEDDPGGNSTVAQLGRHFRQLDRKIAVGDQNAKREWKSWLRIARTA